MENMDDLEQQRAERKKQNEDDIIEIAKEMLDGKYATLVIGIQSENGSVRTYATGIPIIARGLLEDLLEQTKEKQQLQRNG